MASQGARIGWTLAGLLLGASMAAAGAPPAHHPGKAALQAQQKDLDAELAAARTRNEALQAQVSQLEQQGAARQKQMQQRDAEIAALQQKLRAAGVPVSAAPAPASH